MESLLSWTKRTLRRVAGRTKAADRTPYNQSGGYLDTGRQYSLNADTPTKGYAQESSRYQLPFVSPSGWDDDFRMR
jgi:hypothetical protein